MNILVSPYNPKLLEPVLDMSILSITNSTISLASTVYQIKNIAQVGKYRIRPKYFFNITFIIISGLIGFMFPRLLILPFVGIVERILKKKKYGVRIETNSGGTSLIASTKESFIDEVIEKIVEVMNNQDIPANYTFNISDGDIINQSGSFENGLRVG